MLLPGSLDIDFERVAAFRVRVERNQVISGRDKVRLSDDFAKLIGLADERLPSQRLPRSGHAAGLKEVDIGLRSHRMHFLQQKMNANGRRFSQLDDELAGRRQSTLGVALVPQKAPGEAATNGPISAA